MRLPLPSLSSLWVCCASCQDRLVRRGRVPNVTFESYIESRKLSVPRARPARTASRPARLEAALASPQRARTKGVPAACSAAAGCLTSRLSGLFSLWANERGLEKRSSTCRAQFSALKLCHGPLVRPFCFLSAAGALLWLVLAVGKGVRLVFLSAAGALLWFLSFSSLLPAQAREAKLLWLAAPSGPSALKAMRSRYLSTLGLLSSGAVGVVVSHPLSMREGLGSIPGLSMPMCACVCHSLPLPGLSSLWVCCASCQDRLVRRGRVPNVTFESYIESRKLSVPRARPARTASRPARLEAALASPQRARTKGVRRQPAPPRPGA